MCLAVTLDLGHFNEGFQVGPQGGELLGEPFAGVRLHGKHQAVGQVAVVRNGQYVRPGPFFKLVQRFPEIFRILAVELREWQRLVGHRRVAAEEHVAVKVEAAPRGVFIADDRREAARLVVSVSKRGVFLPRVANNFIGFERRFRLVQGGDDLHGRREHLLLVAAFQRVVPAFAFFNGENIGIACEQFRHQAVHFGMIRDHQPVQRPQEPGTNTCGRGDFFAAGEPIGVLLTETAKGPCVHGDRGMEVLVAPENAGRIRAARVGREFLFTEHLVNGLFGIMVFHGERRRMDQEGQSSDEGRENKSCFHGKSPYLLVSSSFIGRS